MTIRMEKKRTRCSWRLSLQGQCKIPLVVITKSNLTSAGEENLMKNLWRVLVACQIQWILQLWQKHSSLGKHLHRPVWLPKIKHQSQRIREEILPTLKAGLKLKVGAQCVNTHFGVVFCSCEVSCRNSSEQLMGTLARRAPHPVAGCLRNRTSEFLLPATLTVPLIPLPLPTWHTCHSSSLSQLLAQIPTCQFSFSSHRERKFNWFKL